MFTLTNHFSLESTWTKQTTSLMENCSNMKQAKQIHALMFKTGLIADSILTSKLLTLCTSPNYGDLAYAHMVFEGINKPNTFMWNAMIRGYSTSNKPEIALLLYYQMLFDSVPHNSYTFPCLLKACSSLLAFQETQQLHAQIIKMGFFSEIFSMNSLLQVYAKCGGTKYARKLFDSISRRDIVSWNSMIDGYMKWGDVEMAYELFKEMPVKNIVTGTTMISGLMSVGQNKEALNLFLEMQSAGFEPDDVALTSTLSACAHLGALEQGKWIHSYIRQNKIHIDRVLGCVLINMYVRSGNMEEALGVFGEMEDRDVSAWTAIIDGFAINGRGREALDWFVKMQKEGVKPNSITFTALLRACSYTGLVEEGKSLFQSIKKYYNLNPSVEHYGCMVDLLGRYGSLKEAKVLIETMPVKPNAVILGSLLKACLIHRDLELGKLIGKTLIKLDPGHSGRYVHLASVFAATGEWEEAAKVRKLMKNKGVSKLPGCSSISLDGTVHEFFASDTCHSQMEQIHHMWDQIAERLRQEGYKHVTKELLLDLENEEKETAIQQHSEKLAIAFGLINTKPGTKIQIFKNLRVCEDCHTVAKLISKIYERDIVMRDRIRFHIFSQGKCSCGDYW